MMTWNPRLAIPTLYVAGKSMAHKGCPPEGRASSSISCSLKYLQSLALALPEKSFNCAGPDRSYYGL
jgi:hypothetical protein